jgi:nucleotide-binding universal stress UspA family protein
VGVHHNPPLPFPESYAKLRGDLEHALHAVRDELAPEAIVHIAADMSPAHALRRVAEAEHADLLVVGSRHRRRLQRIVESDHAMQVLHGAGCAVAVAPDPLPAHPELARIGVGIDGTPESEAALLMACALAERCGASLWLHVVVDDRITGWGAPPAMPLPADVYQEVIGARVEAARHLLRHSLESCAGITANGDVVLGSPAGELALASEDLDLLVLGSRRWGPVKRLALGSTSDEVIRHTACPVLVPPRHAATEHGSDETAVDEVAVS